MKSRIRLIILIAVLLTSLIVTLNKVNLPIVNKKYDNTFSALNVKDDIKFISKEPHSIKHPKERDRVRDFLFERLISLGMHTEYLRYDSIKDRFGEYVDIANLYSVAEPLNGEEASSYVLLMAHLDSRFKLNRKGKWVTSFGAADDGYGLGVILELIRVSNYYKSNWNQGVKVLFTDSEESDLEGIKNTIKHDKKVFDKVGLIINLEARGIKGPAVMFETSPGNSKISELCLEGKSLYSYSFTSAIYNILPNYTDFTLIKNEYPGINFAVIDNLNFYHTNLDNFNNISLNSIQHYGDQISPIIEEYLSNKKYSNPDYLLDITNNYYFSVPIIGFIVLSPFHYYLIIITTIIFFILLFIIKLFKDKSYSEYLKSFIIIISSIIATAGLGFLISYLSAIINGVNFKLTYLPFINGENYIFITSLIFITIINLMIYKYMIIKEKIKSIDIHISSLLLIILLTIILEYFIGDSVLFSFTMIMSFLSFLLNSTKKLKVYTVLPLFLILIYSIPVVYLLNVALTTGSLSIVLTFSSIILWQIIPIADGYLRREI